MKKRSIIIIIGSESDLSQCKKGLKFLKQMVYNGEINEVSVITASIHRNTMHILGLIGRLSTINLSSQYVFITGAGWANHLTGMADAYLRYGLNDTKIPVIGVAFEDKENSVHTKTAMLSISEVPGTQVIYRSAPNQEQFVGESGFLEACIVAALGELP